MMTLILVSERSIFIVSSFNTRRAGGAILAPRGQKTSAVSAVIFSDH